MASHVSSGKPGSVWLAMLIGLAGVIWLAWLAVAPLFSEKDARADAAFVASGDVDFLRVRKATELYREGRVAFLVMSGSGIGGDSGVAMKHEAVTLGVASERILVERRALSTRDNFAFSSDLIRRYNWKRIALVTSVAHMPRALAVARKTIPEVDWIPISVAEPDGSRTLYRRLAREWIKFVWYGARGWV